MYCDGLSIFIVLVCIVQWLFWWKRYRAHGICIFPYRAVWWYIILSAVLRQKEEQWKNDSFWFADANIACIILYTYIPGRDGDALSAYFYLWEKATVEARKERVTVLWNTRSPKSALFIFSLTEFSFSKFDLIFLLWRNEISYLIFTYCNHFILIL